MRFIRLMGLLWAVLGVIALVATFTATLATVLLFGILLLLAGLVQFTRVVSDRLEEPGWHLLSAVLYSLVGVLLIIDPIAGAVGLTLLLALFFLGIGLIRLLQGVVSRKKGRPHGWLYYAGGILNIALAILIIAGWPETGTWVIGLFLGIELLFGGITLLFFPRAAYRTI